MSKKQKPTAEEILREFYENVKNAYGALGEGYNHTDILDEKELNWPDLAATYKKAVQFLKDHSN
jgi:hypothetical protein